MRNTKEALEALKLRRSGSRTYISALNFREKRKFGKCSEIGLEVSGKRPNRSVFKACDKQGARKKGESERTKRALNWKSEIPVMKNEELRHC